MGSLLPQDFLKSVLYIETDKSSCGTGFLVGFKNGFIDDNGDNFYIIYLITNLHVIEGSETIKICINHKSGSNTCENINLSEAVIIELPGIDAIAMRINAKYLADSDYDFFFIKEELIVKDLDEYKKTIEVGQEVFLMGFPLDQGKGKYLHHPLARQGIVSRSDQELLEENQIYLDINNFRGNSGGPIILKPSMFGLEGKIPNQNALLIGLISAYIPQKNIYYDLSRNPPEPAVVFTENSGIAIGIPIFVFTDLIKKDIESMRDK